MRNTTFHQIGVGDCFRFLHRDFKKTAAYMAERDDGKRTLFLLDPAVVPLHEGPLRHGKSDRKTSLKVGAIPSAQVQGPSSNAG